MVQLISLLSQDLQHRFDSNEIKGTKQLVMLQDGIQTPDFLPRERTIIGGDDQQVDASVHFCLCLVMKLEAFGS